MDTGYVDATDVLDLTRARRVGIQYYWQEDFTAKNRLLYLAPLIGIRQSRQIIGDYQLTLEDQARGAQFDDVIAYTHGAYDNHAFDYENESDEAVLWVWLLGNFHHFFRYEVPYRCLLPKDVEGLLVACRALSITYDAHQHFRMQRDMQRIGEAAGIAAAVAARQNTTPRCINVREIQNLLVQSGALSKKGQRTSSPRLNQSVEDLAEQLGPPTFRDAVWLLSHTTKPILPALSKTLRSSSRKMRFWAAVALAMKKHKEAVPELLHSLKDRWDYIPKGTKTVPVWKSAIVLLGRVGHRSAVHSLVGVLGDPYADIDTLIATVRALGRIGDKVAIPDLLSLQKGGKHYYRDRDQWLRQKDYGLKSSSFGESIQTRVREDITWQLELTTAETLAKLGCPQALTVEGYLNDERGYVRRYARKVARIQLPKK